MNATYNKLTVTFADQTKPAIGCGYFFIVHNGWTSHTAFRTKRALRTWMKECGLKLGKRIHSTCWEIKGQYSRNCEMISHDLFVNKYGKLTPFYALDNGDYTLGFIEPTISGNVLHVQNPNSDRKVYDYFEVMNHLEKGTPVN